MNTIVIKGNEIQVNVSVFVFLDKDYPAKDMYVAYCPSLNLVGYGHGEKAAKREFEYMLNEYMGEQLRNHTLESDLKNYGWNKKDTAFDEPKVTDMVGHNDILTDMLDSSAYSKINVATTCPVSA